MDTNGQLLCKEGKKKKKHIQDFGGFLTLNLVRWLSRMGSLYRQLQQLPIASAGQLKPVTDEANTITHSAHIKINKQTLNDLLSPGHQCKGIRVSVPGSSAGHWHHKPVSLLDWHLPKRINVLPPETMRDGGVEELEIIAGTLSSTIWKAWVWSLWTSQSFKTLNLLHVISSSARFPSLFNYMLTNLITKSNKFRTSCSYFIIFEDQKL